MNSITLHNCKVVVNVIPERDAWIVNLMFVNRKIYRHVLPVLYDGQCPICAVEINLMKKLNKKDNVVNFVDITVGEYKPDDHLGITYSQAMGKMHVIVTHGNNTKTHSTPEVTKIYDSMEGMKVMYNAVGLTWLSKLLSYPGIKETSDKFYRWFAVNRYRMTGRDKEECESERCNISDKKK
ncbi:uncharacterized protein LOC143053697 [Mytilus galloprovincialis]|uniref:uncharacterized protein LOC143053697 n=1 Tax=Mytilus galloprovincialis TaxID=29158 RepID=UPI003F7C3446